MDANQVFRCLRAWEALTATNDTALSAGGVDGKFYPRSRLLIAWDIDRIYARLPERFREAVDDIRFGDGDVTGAYRQQQACRVIASAMRDNDDGGNDETLA